MTRSRPRRGALLPFSAALVLAVALGAVGPADAQEESAPPQETPELSFPGMVGIGGASIVFGADEDWFTKYYRMKSKRDCHIRLRGKEKDKYWPLLLFETPIQKKAVVEDYFIGLHELTNQQYKFFLDATSKTSMFTSLKVDSIYAIARKIYGDNPNPWHLESIYWLNEKKLLAIEADVLKGNQAAVNALLAQFGVKEWGEIKEEERVKAWGRFTLPEGVALTVYRRVVPPHWPKGEVAKEQIDTPVRWVSGLDAEAFCEWAGMHLPTEEEWEYAARGPEGWVYPWGEEWDCRKDKNLVLWMDTDPPTRGPAHPNRDRPIAVDSIPKGRSPFGLYHMLGNVMEWTSSIPNRYLRSDAKTLDFFGNEEYRVLRSQSWGDGLAFNDRELLIRNTARILGGPDGGGIHEANRYGAVGFRVAKYPTPARDVLWFRLRAQRRQGLLPEGLVFDPARSYGLERNRFAAPGEEEPGKVFVKGMTSVVGVTPADQLEFSTAKALIEASLAPDAVPVHLGFVYWSSDVAVEVLEVIRIEAPVEREPEEEAPADEGEAGGEPGEEKPGEQEPEPQEKPKPPEKPKPEEKPGEAPPEPGEEPGEKPPAEKPKPSIEERMTWLAGDGEGFLLSLKDGRLALTKPGIAGVRLRAFLTPPGSPTEKPPVVKGDPKDHAPLAKIEGSAVRIRLAIPTRSASSKDVFSVELLLKTREPLGDGWR